MLEEGQEKGRAGSMCCWGRGRNKPTLKGVSCATGWGARPVGGRHLRPHLSWWMMRLMASKSTAFLALECCTFFDLGGSWALFRTVSRHSARRPRTAGSSGQDRKPSGQPRSPPHPPSRIPGVPSITSPHRGACRGLQPCKIRGLTARVRFNETHTTLLLGYRSCESKKKPKSQTHRQNTTRKKLREKGQRNKVL